VLRQGSEAVDIPSGYETKLTKDDGDKQ
jgi:hypothetical protein